MRIRILYPGYKCPLAPVSGISIPDHISETLVTILLKFFVSRYPTFLTFLTLDPGWKNPDRGFGINIPDPQHCSREFFSREELIVSVVVGYQVHRIRRHHAGGGKSQGQDQEIQEENPLRFP